MGGKYLYKAAGGDFQLGVRALALEVGSFITINIVVQAPSDRLRLHLDDVPRAALSRQEPRR